MARSRTPRRRSRDKNPNAISKDMSKKGFIRVLLMFAVAEMREVKSAEEVAQMEDAGLAAEEITLGEDEYFVLGDNRNNSEDSRYANIGNIKKEYIIGKVWFRVAPFKDFGFL